MRIAYEKRGILRFAVAEDARGALRSARHLLLAPWPIPRQRMEAEMRVASVSSASAPLLVQAARDFVNGAAVQWTEVRARHLALGEKGMTGIAMVVLERNGNGLLCQATFG